MSPAVSRRRALIVTLFAAVVLGVLAIHTVREEPLISGTSLLGAVSSSQSYTSPNVTITAGTFTGIEGSTGIEITFGIDDSNHGGFSISWGFSGGTADATDVSAWSGTTTVTAGATTAALSISITDDALVEGEETTTFVIQEGTGYVPGTPSSSAATIQDNDSSASVSAPGTPDLVDGSDTGASSSDDNTYDTTPTFSVSCTTGASVQLYVGGVLSGSSGTCVGSTVQLTTAAITPDATVNITAKQTVGDTMSSASSALPVTIDTTAPTGTGTPDMTSATDTGSSSSDNNTSSTTTAYTVACTTGNTVTLIEGVSTVIGSGTCSASTVTIVSSGLTSGSYIVTAKETDAAGNIGDKSSPLTVTIDVTPPSAPGAPDMTSATDSAGVSTSDNNTSDTTPDFTMSCESGTTVYLKEGSTALGNGTCASSTVTITSSTLSSGSHTLKATQTDAAGNSSTDSSTLGVTIDTTAPSVSTFSPTDDSTSMSLTGNFVLTYDETVVAYSGNISLYTSGNSLVEAISVTNTSLVTVSSAAVEINPTSNLSEGQSYYILLAAGAFTDTAGNASAAISSSTAWSFTATATCGNGTKADTEGCDDYNVTNGDGCSASCSVETGWACTPASPSVCSTSCGDAVMVGAEGCDDGSTVNNDGCSSTCTVEGGWSCTGTAPSVCAATCGDSIVAPGEQCDDGNIISGDGCSSTCVIEYCGDGIVQMSRAEQCDLGNLNTPGGDNGCNTNCVVPGGSKNIVIEPPHSQPKVIQPKGCTIVNGLQLCQNSSSSQDSSEYCGSYNPTTKVWIPCSSSSQAAKKMVICCTTLGQLLGSMSPGACGEISLNNPSISTVGYSNLATSCVQTKIYFQVKQQQGSPCVKPVRILDEIPSESPLLANCPLGSANPNCNTTEVPPTNLPVCSMGSSN